ncbi:MAG: PIN domain-containing protein [Acidimicrobiales bacterium]
MGSRPATVVVDTNVFSADLLRATHPLVEVYRPLLAGRRFVISFQTVAEILVGARQRHWAGTDDSSGRASWVRRSGLARTAAPSGVRRIAARL